MPKTSQSFTSIKKSAKGIGDPSKEFRIFFQKILKSKIKSKKDKEELANYLDRSVPSVELMLYHGGGGLDAWLNAFVFCFGLNVEKLEKIAIELSLISKSDETNSLYQWQKLGQSLTEKERNKWYYLIKASSDFEQGQETTIKNKKS